MKGDDAALHEWSRMERKTTRGTELQGRTLVIMQLGAIGRLVANAGSGLGMKVIGYDPEITVDAAWSLSSSK